MGGSGRLLHLAFYFGIHVASGASKSLFDMATEILPVRAKIDPHSSTCFCSLCIPLVEQPTDAFVRAQRGFVSRPRRRCWRLRGWAEGARMVLLEPRDPATEAELAGLPPGTGENFHLLLNQSRDAAFLGLSERGALP